MAKKNKTEAAAPGKISKIKASPKSAPAKAKRASRPKKSPVEKIHPEPTATPVTIFDPSDDQISMRAYFISERRRRLDLPGDANSDWLEAKRQLLTEVGH